MVALCINGVSGLFLSCFHYCIGCSFSILQSWQMQRFCTSFNATLNINWKTKWGNTKIIFERMMRKLNTCKSIESFMIFFMQLKTKKFSFPFILNASILERTCKMIVRPWDEFKKSSKSCIVFLYESCTVFTRVNFFRKISFFEGWFQHKKSLR